MRDLVVGDKHVITNLEGNKKADVVGMIVRITRRGIGRSPNYGYQYRCIILRGKRDTGKEHEIWLYAAEMRPVCMFCVA